MLCLVRLLLISHSKTIPNRKLRGRTKDNAKWVLVLTLILRYTFRPNFFSNSASEIWIMVGRPWGQQ